MSDTDLLEHIEVQILRARPGDIVCLRSTRPMTPDDAFRIKEQASRLAPEGVQFMVMDGLTVDSVIRPDEVHA